MADAYQIEMQARIDHANANAAQRTRLSVSLSWQNYADVLWGAVEARQTKGAEGRHLGLRLKEFAVLIREALDEAGIPKPQNLHLPPKL